MTSDDIEKGRVINCVFVDAELESSIHFALNYDHLAQISGSGNYSDRNDLDDSPKTAFMKRKARFIRGSFWSRMFPLVALRDFDPETTLCGA